MIVLALQRNERKGLVEEDAKALPACTLIPRYLHSETKAIGELLRYDLGNKYIRSKEEGSFID